MSDERLEFVALSDGLAETLGLRAPCAAAGIRPQQLRLRLVAE